jgi:uncharacterized glyoxalase superfamily protein PhnB
VRIRTMLPMVTTDKLDEVRDYYVTYFGFRVTFDYPGHFIALKSAGDDGLEIALMASCDEAKPYAGHGVSLCFLVDDVDAECERLTQAGLPIVVPLQDNPWGGRSFISVDPAGVSVYVYSPIEPSDEFRQYIRE